MFYIESAYEWIQIALNNINKLYRQEGTKAHHNMYSSIQHHILVVIDILTNNLYMIYMIYMHVI